MVSCTIDCAQAQQQSEASSRYVTSQHYITWHQITDAVPHHYITSRQIKEAVRSPRLLGSDSYPAPFDLCIPELHDHLVALQLPLAGRQQVLQGGQLRPQLLHLLFRHVFSPQNAH